MQAKLAKVGPLSDAAIESALPLECVSRPSWRRSVRSLTAAARSSSAELRHCVPPAGRDRRVRHQGRPGRVHAREHAGDVGGGSGNGPVLALDIDWLNRPSELATD